jgi:hypothetical protein
MKDLYENGELQKLIGRALAPITGATDKTERVFPGRGFMID